MSGQESRREQSARQIGAAYSASLEARRGGPRLNIAVTTVRRLARRGKLPGFRIGKREWRFNVEQIDLWRLVQTKERMSDA